MYCNFLNKGATRWLLSSILIFSSNQVFAMGECGLSCCLAGANSSGVTLAKNFGLAVQYEYSDMVTIRNGTNSVTPDQVIDQHWNMGSSYSVPTKMIMEKLSFIGAYPVNERWQILGIVPLVRNQMDMRQKSGMGMVMNMTMDTISGLGDVSALALYTAYTDAPVRPKERLTLGFGVKMPTGSNDARKSNGDLVHAMMQLGSESWDGLFTLNYMRAWYPLVTQVNAFYHLTTEGDGGYEFGNQYGVDVVGRYQVSNYVNLGLEANVIHADRDKDHNGNFSAPATSMVDNTANTGLTSVFVSPGIQVKIPDSGGSVGLKDQHPVRQDVNGYQQVLDGRWLATVSWAW